MKKSNLPNPTCQNDPSWTSFSTYLNQNGINVVLNNPAVNAYQHTDKDGYLGLGIATQIYCQGLPCSQFCRELKHQYLLTSPVSLSTPHQTISSAKTELQQMINNAVTIIFLKFIFIPIPTPY